MSEKVGGIFEDEMSLGMLENSILYLLKTRTIHNSDTEKTLEGIYSGLAIMHRQEYSDDNAVYPTICFYLGEDRSNKAAYGGLFEKVMPIYFEGFCLVKTSGVLNYQRSRQQRRNLRDNLGALLTRYGGTFDIIDTSSGNAVIGGGHISEVRLSAIAGTFNFNGSGLITYHLVEGTETGN